MIEVHHLTKRFDEATAVDDLTFTVRPGVVTGFLGPNGAGKTTTMRMIVGLARPTSGRVTVNGRSFAEHGAPLDELGVLLDAGNVHPGRSARAHLSALAATHGIGRRRVDEVLELTGIQEVAGRKAGKFSLGMRQRLGIAAALLGDPHTLILDEPINGLDPDGVIWVRTLLRRLAAEGRTVFLSSHLMSEMSLTADHLVIIGRGRMIADAPLADVIAATSHTTVRVRTPEPQRLATAVAATPGASATEVGGGTLEIAGADAAAVALLAAQAGIHLDELSTTGASLEDAYLSLTHSSLEYRSTTGA
ncbi:ABC transporter ATP-binding protein [Naasia sp. SYSU D00948]|uniref:ABC transporter ATP-binding protein n=1 Tax=Naasia sp. SYSU D00948 TaxID=2817379 RepID=UPI001B315D1C|nr:ABC transporter ATP-binding protein [Naasia sp. SYSU D00948]